MKTRMLKKIVTTMYDAAVKGDYKSAYSRLQKVSPNKQRKVLNVFNEQTFERLGTENGSTVVANFAGYRGLQDGMRALGGTQGLAEQINQSMNLFLSETIERASQETLKKLPQTSFDWIKFALKESWIDAKSLVSVPASKFKNYIKNKIKLPERMFTKNKTVGLQQASKVVKNIPHEIKPLLMNLEGKSGQEFVDRAYLNIVEYMKLLEIAPKNIRIQGGDGIMTVTGGYDPIKNTIEYTQGFLTKLSRKQQMNLISHELKHCEQITNMLRTEGIGVNEYARAIAENSVKGALNENSLDIVFKMKYQKALQNGKGEEFIQNAIENMTKKIIPEIETNFSEILKLPKIKADSPDGLKAIKHLEAQRSYEGLDIFGFGSEKYQNNPLEMEAYAFGDNMEKLVEDFIS